jgi:hypothetical protein
VSNVALSLPGTDGMAWVVTQYVKEGTSTPIYRLRFGASGNLVPVIKATLLSGPGIVGPIDMRPDGTDGYQWDAPAGGVPSAGSKYLFEVTYADGRICNLSASVTGAWTSIPTALAPIGAGAGSTKPTLSWSAPAVAPSTFWYRINLWEASGNYGDIWYTPIPSSITSLLYNDNGGASQALLTSGKQYQWVISAQDADGNTAGHLVNFSVP